MRTHRSSWQAMGRMALMGLAALAGAVGTATAQPGDGLALPTNPVAVDSGAWGDTSRIEMLEFVTPPGSGLWPNFYETVFLTNYEKWHPQHVVRLANKAGRAYFMVTQSREHNGYLTLLQTDPGLLDPATDRIVPKGPGQPVGKSVWQDVYTGTFNGKINPVGNWNHPGKMDVLGGVLVVAAQNWDGGRRGTSPDKVLFYDVRDPEHPRYWGAIAADDLGVAEISTVALVRTPAGDYLLCAGGNHRYATLWARAVSPDIKAWNKLAVDDAPFSGQHGMNFNSLQQATEVPGGDAKGVERMLYFDASAEQNKFSFQAYRYDAASHRPVGNGSRDFNIQLPGADRDWNTSSLFVTRRREAVIYTVTSGNFEPHRLFQVHNP